MNYQHFHIIDDNPETNKHLAEIVESIDANGWLGLPLLSNGNVLLNGCHRATACEILEIEPVVHEAEISCGWCDSPYTDRLLGDLVDASSTEEVYSAIKALHEEGLIDDLSLEIIEAEWQKE
jgi:hypothetical protein